MKWVRPLLQDFSMYVKDVFEAINPMGARSEQRQDSLEATILSASDKQRIRDKHVKLTMCQKYSNFILDMNYFNCMAYLIYICKKAWETGQVEVWEFSKLVDSLRDPRIFIVIVHIVGAFRLNNQEELAPASYQAMAEIFLIVLNQGSQTYNSEVISSIVNYANSYYKSETGGRVYLMEGIRKHRVLALSDFWIGQTLNRVCRMRKEEKAGKTDQGTLRKNLVEAIGNVFLSSAFEMLSLGLAKGVVEEALVPLLGLFKLPDKQMVALQAFIKQFQ